MKASEEPPQNAIGVIDWGIGGLSVYKQLKKKFKNVSTVYLSDAGFTPYGKTPPKKLTARLNQVTNFFRQRNISTVIVACNAASTVLNEVQKKNPDIHFFGMLSAGEVLIKSSRKNQVLVLGGQRTIESQYFQEVFKKSRQTIQGLVAQPLSALIEKGNHHTSVFEKKVHSLARQSHPQTNAVLLACTHYPAATKVFKKFFKQAVILDPALQLVAQLAKSNRLSFEKQTNPESSFFTTGSVAQSKRAALKAFRLKIPKFQKVKLNP